MPHVRAPTWQHIDSGLGRGTRNPGFWVHRLPDAQVEADLSASLRLARSIGSPDGQRVRAERLHVEAGTLEVPAQIAPEGRRVESNSHAAVRHSQHGCLIRSGQPPQRRELAVRPGIDARWLFRPLREGKGCPGPGRRAPRGCRRSPRRPGCFTSPAASRHRQRRPCWHRACICEDQTRYGGEARRTGRCHCT